MRFPPVDPDRVVLSLHGFQETPQSWNTLLAKADAYVTVISADPAKPFQKTSPHHGVNYDELEFGAFDVSSRRRNAKGELATKPSSGDYETFEQLGQEVQSAVHAIVQNHTKAKVLLVAHSRGGLAARAFLQGPAAGDITSVVGLITVGTPHKGSYFGRIWKYLKEHPENEEHPDTKTWEVAHALNGKGSSALGIAIALAKKIGFDESVDVLRPTVRDLATGSAAIRKLNQGIGNLPTGPEYYELVYDGRKFGAMPAEYDVFAGQTVKPPKNGLVRDPDDPDPYPIPPLPTGGPVLKVSDEAKAAILQGVKRRDLRGDGIVDEDSQRFSDIPGLPAGIKFHPKDPNRTGIFHTVEHDDASRILATIQEVFPPQ